MGWHGRYGGQRMTVYATNIPGAISIARWAKRVEALTPAAKNRLRILDWHRFHGKNVSLTARHFGLRRATIKEWQRRFGTNGILGLIEHSRRPQRPRRPTTSWQVVSEIVRLRKEYPAWSKYKIRALITRQGINVSASTIGRILKKRGLVDQKVSRKRRRAALKPKARFPRGLRISKPGDLVQMDVKHIMLVGGKRLYQFTAIDVLTKIRVLRIYPSESSRNGADFLEYCLREFPFPICAVQTDNGASFLREFERFCMAKQIPHYFIYPRTPKQNTYVERSHGSDKKEFYQQGNVWSDSRIMQERLSQWQHIWNDIRPHQALNYLTPKEYLKKWQEGRLPTKDTITLQT